MSKNEFKRCMQQGLGRCVLTLKQGENIEKYREIVLWGGLHSLSFDTQCEGTRAAYVYELTKYYRDDGYFVVPTVDAFLKMRPNADPLFSHLCELLECFAEGGNEEASAALNAKYAQLYAVLIEKRRHGGIDHARDAFEHLCIALTSLGGLDAFWKIAEDMGALFGANPHYSADDFDWFCVYSERKFGAKKLRALLGAQAKHSENIRRFHTAYLTALQAVDGIVHLPPSPPTADAIAEEVASSAELSPASRVLFSKRADPEEKRALALRALSEDEPIRKAELLSAFIGEKDIGLFPHEVLIGYARSEHACLREVALELLIHCRSEAVRAYAHELLGRREDTARAIEMLIASYIPRDKALLLDALSNIGVDYGDRTNWHSIGGAILDAFEEKCRLPRECLLWIYETTLCSYCRATAVRQLAKHRWLTDALIEECRFDSNDEIADYIDRYYPKK